MTVQCRQPNHYATRIKSMYMYTYASLIKLIIYNNNNTVKKTCKKLKGFVVDSWAKIFFFWMKHWRPRIWLTLKCPWVCQRWTKCICCVITRCEYFTDRTFICKVKVKPSPWQAVEAYRVVRLRLSTILAGRTLVPRNIAFLLPILRRSEPQGLVQQEELRKLKKLFHFIGSRTHHLPACSVVS
jgi:hypothetical protein